MIKRSLQKQVAVLAVMTFFVTNLYAQKVDWPRTFLWRISGNGLSKPSFLYGTIHLSDKKLFNFGDSLYRALEQADGFNIEIDADTLVNASMRKWTEKNNGRLLKSLLQKKEYDKYADKLSRSLGKPANQITTKDIWLAKNSKTAEAYRKGNMQHFMDLYLYGIAKKQGKQVGGIEDLEDQLGMIDDLFDEMDLAYVTSDTLQQQGRGMVDIMKDIYLNKDLNAILAMTDGSIQQKYKEIMLTKRNVKMAWRMDSLAQVRSSFFAIGVAHLPGDSGVIRLLQQRGFTVEPVYSTKTIAPQKYQYVTVDRPWVTYTNDLKLYSVSSPGAMQPVDMMTDAMEMKYYYDVSDGKVYYSALINSIADPNKKDSVFKAMIKRMAAKTRTIISQKPITKQGFEGREVIFQATDDQLLHLNVYLTGDYGYMAMVMTKKADLHDGNAKRFLESFTMTPTASVSRPYIVFRDTAQAFSIRLPQQPTVAANDASGDAGTYQVYSASDFSTGNSYAITVTNTRAGKYIVSDSMFFEQVKSNLAALMEQDTLTTIVSLQGHPVLRMSGTAKGEQAFLQAVVRLRGNRAYILLAQSKMSTARNAQIEDFFKSFELLEYSKNPWQKTTAPDSSFETWLPPDYIVDEEAVDSSSTVEPRPIVLNDFMYHDKSTATSYTIQREHFSRYYFESTDSVFFHHAAAKFKDDADSILRFSLSTFHGDKAADIDLGRSNGSVIKRLRLILHGDTLYKVFSYTPRWLANNENTTKFFNNFSIRSQPAATTVFVNKTSKLVADLAAADSASFAEASDYLYDAEPEHKDLQAYYPLLLKPLYDFEESAYNTNNKLIELVAGIADSSTVRFVSDHYTTLDSNAAKLQYLLLKLLIRMKEPFATETAARLLTSTSDPKGELSLFAAELNRNLPAAKILFPRIMAMSSNTSNALAFAAVTKSLFDSNYIRKADVLTCLSNFVAAADQQQKGMSLDPDDFDYDLLNVFDVIGVADNAAGNAKLLEYSRLSNPEVSYAAVCWLIQNKQSVPVDVLKRLASSDLYRTALYDTLLQANKSSFFPAAQKTQKQFAASYIYSSASDDDEPAAIVLQKEKVVDFKGEKKRFFLFKVSFGDGDETSHHLGIAGPFAMDSREVTSFNEATGVYYSAPFAVKEMAEQFEAYLKELGSE